MFGRSHRLSLSRRRPCQCVLIAIAACCPRLASAQAFTPPIVPPEMRYVIDASLDATSGTLEGHGVARIRNAGSTAIGVLTVRWFDWRSGSYEVTVNGHRTAYPSSTESVEIPLSAPLVAGASMDVSFRFSRALGDLDRGFSIQRWFPYLWWGYDTHASYDIGIATPAGLLVGASARRDPASGRYRAGHIRSFGLFVARGMEVRERVAGPTLVRSFFRPDMRECAELVLETAGQAVEFYRKRFGTYPQPSLTIIPGGKSPMGGYPYATAMIVVHGQEACGEKPKDSHWRWIASHEVGHQYWLEHVLEKDPEQGFGWLMIGLGIWTDREFARAHLMPAVHAGFLDSYADTVRKGLNTTLEIAPEELRKVSFDFNTQVTHFKGFGVVSALASIVGPATFDRIWRRCLAEYAGRRMGTAEFRQVAELESGQDLGWFFVPMLRTSRFISYEVTDRSSTNAGAAFTSRVAISSNGDIRLPIPVEALFADGTRQRQRLDRSRDEQTLVFTSKSAIDRVVIDPDREFPLVVPAPELNAARLAELVANLPWTGGAIKPLKLYRRALELDAKDVSMLGKLGLTLAAARQNEEALAAFDRMVDVNSNKASTWYFAALVWRGMMNDLLGRRDLAIRSYEEALKVTGAPSMQHSQFGLTLDRAWVEERLRVPFAWK